MAPEDSLRADYLVSMSEQSDVVYWAARSKMRLDREEPYLRIQFACIFVADQERSLRFFTEQLGFRLIADARFASGERHVEVAPPDGTASLALMRPLPGSEGEKQIGHSGMVTLATEDVTGKYELWSGRGVEFLGPPVTPSWGGTFARFRDPDGNLFALVGFDAMREEIERGRQAAEAKLNAERRAAQELEIARQVQARLFPQKLPEVRGLDYAGMCIQARAVGGDYYDFVRLPGNRLALVVGDIAGKGIAAALLMANLQANLRSQCAIASQEPPRVLEAVNRLLFENTEAASYATLFFAEYDETSKRMRYVNCGHLPALVLRADGSVERLEPTSVVLGLFDGWDCSLGESRLDEGDVMALYTDGVTESFNEEGVEFGEDRLVEALQRHRGLSSEAMAKAVVGDVQAFCRCDQYDDITLIVAKSEGAKGEGT